MLSRNLRIRTFIGLLFTVGLTLTTAACASASAGIGPPSGGSGQGVHVDAALAAKVPAAIRASGTIVIGTDSTYAPSEFLAADGKTVVGFDVDVFNAVAATLGLKTTWVSANVDAIIPGVISGKYDIGASSFTINKTREQAVTMVSYFDAGTQWAQRVGGTLDPDSACGKRVGVQASTVQVDDVSARSKACTAAGRPVIDIERYRSQADVTAAVVSGKDDAMLADSPVCAYAVKQTGGQLSLVGQIYASAPYGYVLPPHDTLFGSAVAGAVALLISSGRYTAILDKWGVTGGAITSPAVDPTS
jgi:polar amino acid transport system substrate-binding protein